MIRPEKKSAPADERIASMARQLITLIEQDGVTQAVVEDRSSAPPFRAGGRRTTAGHGTACKATGAMLSVLWTRQIPVETVTPIQWSRGVAKAARAKRLNLTADALAADKGLDAADALGIARWWWNRNRLAAG